MRLLRRAANSAASLTRLARSAPEKPGVPRAMIVELDVGRNRHLAHMHSQDLLAADDIRQRHHHLAVEAAGTQQRRIEHVGTVGRGDHDHALVGLEAVHLDQQLVQGLLALVVAAAEAGAAMAADGVDFVDEDDAGRMLLAPVRTCRAPAPRPRRRTFRRSPSPKMEKNGTLASPAMARASRVLPVPGGPTSRTPLAECARPGAGMLRIAQELDDFLQLFLGLVDAGDIGEV